MKVIERYLKSSSRTKESLNNIVLSFIAKGISIVCSLMIVPMTINYVNTTKYGIWLTLSSIIGWIGFFDLGLGNGFRNRFAEAKASGNIQLAKQYVATTYYTIGVMMTGLFLVLFIGNFFIDWSKMLNVNTEYKEELSRVFVVLILFFCFNMVVRLFSTLLTADQKQGLASLIGAIGQVLSLCAIYILTKVSSGSLLNLALFYSSIPTLFLFIVSFLVFHFTPYKQYIPSYKNVEYSLIKNIINLGIKFFIIYLSMIVVFQIINIVISREMGPEAVTEYNIAYKYFYVLHNTVMIIVVPFWSAFTDAYVKKEQGWMIKAKRSLELVCLSSVFVAILMLLISDWFYDFWVGDSVKIDISLSLAMAVYMVIMNIGGTYMNLINGIGTIKIQLIIYCLFALFSYPSMILLIRQYGLVGVVVYPTIVVLLQAVFGKIQIEKLIYNKASGIWTK